MKTVLIVSEGWPNNIRLALDLASRGVTLRLLVVDPQGRYRPFAPSFPVESVADLETLRDSLFRLAATRAFDLVWALSEQTLIAAWKCEAMFGCSVVSDVPPPLRPLFLDKGAMIRFVSSLGVPTPPQQPIPIDVGTAGALADLGFPCVIKGEQGEAGTGVHFAHNTQQALAAVAAEARRHQSRPVAQAFIPGDVVSVGAVVRTAAPCCSTAGA